VLGRKRFVLVDTEGWLIAPYVDGADVPEGDGGRCPVEAARREHPRLTHLWIDAGFGTTFADWVREVIGWTVAVVTKVAGQVGFQVQPRRWVVERTFAWLGKHRRLSKEYDQLEESTEAWIYLAMIGLMARRLTQVVN
jgi:putative transposase